MPFHLESLWGATLMPIRGCLMDWYGTKWWGWGKVRSGFKPFVDQSSSNFWTMQETKRQKIFTIKCRSRRKTEEMLKFIGPIFSWGTTPTVLQQIVSAIYHPPFGKVWLSSVRWSPSAKLGNEAECRIYEGWVKMAVEFEAVCGPKFMTFWEDVGDPL